MRKKKLEELTKNVTKSVIKEMQKEEEKKLKEHEKMIEQQVTIPVVQHTKEDLDEIRKNFLKIFLFSVALLFTIIVIFIIDPFSDRNKDNKNNQEEIIIPEELEEDKLVNRKDGIIENSNEEILKLHDILVPNQEEYFLYDSTYLYSKNDFLVSDIDEQYLLYLMSKTSDFAKYIENTELLTSAEICSKDGNIRIPVSEINEMLQDNFGRYITNNSDFIYTHYIGGSFSTYIRFTYSDGYYVSFCEGEKSFDYNKIATPIISEVVKEKDELRIKNKVAFITSEKVYSDYNLTNVISDNVGADMLTYINKADSYTYVFKLTNNRYILNKIVKN